MLRANKRHQLKKITYIYVFSNIELEQARGNVRREKTSFEGKHGIENK